MGALASSWHERLGTTRSYHGIDSNPTLLSRARAALDGIRMPGSNSATWSSTRRTAVNTIWWRCSACCTTSPARRPAPAPFCAAGRAGRAGRAAGFRRVALLRIRSASASGSYPGRTDLQVEPHDYLLDWRRGEHALRYCHYVDDAEHAALIAATGLTEITTYRADGRTNDMNRYSALEARQLMIGHRRTCPPCTDALISLVRGAQSRPALAAHRATRTPSGCRKSCCSRRRSRP